MYVLPKERNALIETRYAQLIKEYGEDMDAVQEIIKEYIEKLDSKGQINEPAMFSHIKNKYFSRKEKIKNDQPEIVPLTEDVAVNMIGIEYPDINLVTAKLIRVMATLRKKIFDVEQIKYFNNLTYAEVGKIKSLTTERIRQIDAKSLRLMRHPSRSRILRTMKEYFYDTNLSCENILDDVTEHWSELYDFINKFDSKIFVMSDSEIKTGIKNILDNESSIEAFSRILIAEKKLTIKRNKEVYENEAVVIPKSIEPDPEEKARVTIKKCIDDIEYNSSRIIEYKHFPYKIYMIPIMEKVNKIIENNVTSINYDLILNDLSHINKSLSSIKGDTLDANIVTLVDVLDFLDIPTDSVNIKNLKLGFVFNMIEGIMDKFKMETCIDRSNIKYVFGNDISNIPLWILFMGGVPKLRLTEAFMGVYTFFNKSMVADNTIEIPITLLDAYVSDEEELEYEKEYLKHIKSVEEHKKLIKELELKEKEERKRAKEEKIKRKKEEERKKQEEIAKERRMFLENIRDGFIPFNEHSAYDAILILADGYENSRYKNFVISHEDYIIGIINKALERMRDKTLLSVTLDELDPYMVHRPWDELYRIFSYEPIKSRINMRLDIHYWIIIDLFVVILDYYGYKEE